eukprot:CAMPEP_0172156896 /NCGR_PEP_ID=MMETSP1050-20130122/3487_1 /TAXON_ID=233186 /ORGANISM="Cryptomonas curvata, Strain CCAP979/52" /LENGTH=429 /DNA_ID=CAMNT_0012826059 /DNA_START=65 /DNA_END=1351 /DNA_ORIENTATION=+
MAGFGSERLLSSPPSFAKKMSSSIPPPMLSTEDPQLQRRYDAQIEIEEAGRHLTAISQSPDGRRLAVGGRNVLSILSLEGLTTHGGCLTGAEQSQLSRSRIKCTTQDVRWHPTQSDYIATGSSDGKVTLWNLGALRGGNLPLQAWSSKEHEKSVWRIAWCLPHQGQEHLLLSGALDGTIRMWDFRGGFKSVMVHKNSQREQVRDLRVCGGEPWKIAAGLEVAQEGAIVLWDVRSPDTYLMRIDEETAVHAVDWHPAHTDILASGRQFRGLHSPGCIKVWDTSQNGRDIHPIAKIPTADGVSNLMWRPNFRTQIACTYLNSVSQLDVWDTAGHASALAGLPLASCTGHTEPVTVPVTDLVWQDAHVFDKAGALCDNSGWLLSCAKDGTVRRQHVLSAHLPFLHARNAAFAIDSDGGVISSVCPISRDSSR